VTNLGGGARSVFSAASPENAIGKHVKVMPCVPVRIDFDRREGQGFNAEDLLKPGLSVEPKVRVRWLPRTRQLNSASVGRGSLLAQWRVDLPPVLTQPVSRNLTGNFRNGNELQI
jgi:hypothetical protein